MRTIKTAYTLYEAAFRAGLAPETLRALVGWGKLPVIPAGRHAVIRKDVLEVFLERNRGRDLERREDVCAVRPGDF